MSEVGKFDLVLGALKLMPLGLSRFATKSGLVHLFSKLWRGPFRKSTKEIVESLTDNPDLRAIFCYSWGDYGTPPSKSHFLMQVLFRKGKMRLDIIVNACLAI